VAQAVINETGLAEALGRPQGNKKTTEKEAIEELNKMKSDNKGLNYQKFNDEDEN